MAAKLIYLFLGNLCLHLIILKIASRYCRQSFKSLSRYYLYGCLTVLPLAFLVLGNFINPVLMVNSSGIIASYLLWAFGEECLKKLPCRDYNLKALPLALALALGFAGTENALFLMNISSFSDLILQFLTRFWLDSSIHVLGSGVVFLSLWYWRKRLASQFFGGAYLISLGLGAVSHFSLNFLQIIDLHYLVVPIIMGVFYVSSPLIANR